MLPKICILHRYFNFPDYKSLDDDGLDAFCAEAVEVGILSQGGTQEGFDHGQQQLARLADHYV